jgi:predicted amidohydrolase
VLCAGGRAGRDASGAAETFGHAAIIDPWGRVLAQQDQGEAVLLAERDSTNRRPSGRACRCPVTGAFSRRAPSGLHQNDEFKA